MADTPGDISEAPPVAAYAQPGQQNAYGPPRFGITRQQLEDADQEAMWQPEPWSQRLNRLRGTPNPDIDPNITDQAPRVSSGGEFSNATWNRLPSDRSI